MNRLSNQPWSQEKTLVAGVDHHGVPRQVAIVQVFEESAHVVVDRGNAAEIVLDEALVLPGQQGVAARPGGGSILRSLRVKSLSMVIVASRAASLRVA